ncbi:Lipocalin-like domain protein [compost metagenome]
MQGDTVLHHVRHSLFPNWEGGTQRRVAQLDGNVLALTARLEEGTSEARTARLVWRRSAA